MKPSFNIVTTLFRLLCIHQRHIPKMQDIEDAARELLQHVTEPHQWSQIVNIFTKNALNETVINDVPENQYLTFKLLSILLRRLSEHKYALHIYGTKEYIQRFRYILEHFRKYEIKYSRLYHDLYTIEPYLQCMCNYGYLVLHEDVIFTAHPVPYSENNNDTN